MCSRLRKYLDNQFVNIFTSGAKVYKNVLWHLEHFVCFICNQSDVHVTYAPKPWAEGSGVMGLYVRSGQMRKNQRNESNKVLKALAMVNTQK